MFEKHVSHVVQNFDRYLYISDQLPNMIVKVTRLTNFINVIT